MSLTILLVLNLFLSFEIVFFVIHIEKLDNKINEIENLLNIKCKN